MTGTWALAALWLGLALIASLLSIWFRISTALSEIVVETIAQLIIGAAVGAAVLGTDESWVKFLSGTGAIVLTFAAARKVPLQTHVLTGHPIVTILDVAQQLGVDLLVIGATGQYSIHERMIGSRADRLVHLAFCPVLVVR
jgi:nucleotide-binding universal stress UspA family protein